jgi:hypothetical protein
MKAFFLAKPGFILSGSSSVPGTANLVSILRSFSEVYTSPELYDESLADGIKACMLDKTKENSTNHYVQDINAMVSRCLDRQVDVYVTAGGDGIMSYVASAVIMNKGKNINPLFLGFPAGTANAGPIVHTLGTGKLDSLTKVSLDAVEVSDGKEVIGYGFNDVVIGNTFLGTVDGRLVNLDAGEMFAYGRQKTADIGEKIASETLNIALNGESMEIGMDAEIIRQICISPLQGDRFSQRAVFGGLLNSVGDAHPCAAAFISRNMIDSNPATWNYRGPVTTTHICFTENEVLEISGLGEDAQIIIDGNPFMRKNDRISFRIVPGACTALWDMGGKGR